VIVVVLSKCPPALRGDLTKWLLEVSPGIYCGNTTARVRDELWERIVKHLKTGQATMVFSSDGEQRLDFRVHNTEWIPVDYEGIKLVRHPSNARVEGKSRPSEDRETTGQREKKCSQPKAEVKSALPSDYCLLDLETTGLKPEADEILEIGLLRVRQNQVTDQYQAILRTEADLPQLITDITGITTEEMKANGKDGTEALKEVLHFVGRDPVLGYNLPFDMAFLQHGFVKLQMAGLAQNRTVDVLSLARLKMRGLQNYRLATVATHFGIERKEKHRAIEDCWTTFRIYERLRTIDT
jgi:CRISPR-associated protein Cas2